MPEIRAVLGVNLGLPELVQVFQELDHVGPAAAGESERWLVVPEILEESVPVPAFLGFVAVRL